jgi:hypothetical protein
LGVEEQEQSSDSVGSGQRLVVEQSASVHPPAFGIVGADRALPMLVAEGQPLCQPILGRPADEVAGLVPIAEVLACFPLVQVGLAAGRESQTAVGQPLEEVDGGGDVAADVGHLQVGGVAGAETSSQASQVVPDRVAVQHRPFFMIATGSDDPGMPSARV